VTDPSGPAFRAGFVAFVGRPNVGKSTLTNALVGEKVVITSSKPQTTRRVVRGIVHRPDTQLVVLDTPGLHRPRTLLGERLNAEVRAAWSEVDVVGLCVPADEKVGPGDRFIARELSGLRKVVKVAVVTKTDRVPPSKVAEQLLAVADLGRAEGIDWAEVVPVSALRGEQTGLLADLLARLVPESPPLYPDGDLTDEPENLLVAELIREAALEGVRDELPHSIAVIVEEMQPREDRPADRPLLDVHAFGATARRHIEALLGTQVYLDLRVTVAKDWQRDPRQLRRLGF
jgi:GTP-binding protein Era